MPARKNKKPARKKTASKTRPKTIVRYYGQKPATKPRRRRSLRKMIPGSQYMVQNFMKSGMVVLGGMGGNAITGFLPVKQPLVQSLINIIAGLVVTGMAGKNEMIALAGAGLSANGILKGARTLFPTIPYLSGEDIQITVEDVQRAIATGAVSPDEGQALIDAMSMSGAAVSDDFDEDDDSELLLGTVRNYAGYGGESAVFAGNDFETTETY